MSDERQGPVPRGPTPDDPSPDPRAPSPSPPPDDGAAEGAGGRSRVMHPERPCLNCGDPTPGEYCPSCGQRKVDTRASVRTLMTEVLEDQLILDRRLPRTAKALFFQPGKLTVEHLDGRIVRYIQPFRLYLVSSLIFFVLLSFFSFRLVRRVAAGQGGAVAVAADSLAAAVDSLAAGTDSGTATDSAAPVDSAAGPSPGAGAPTSGGGTGGRTLAMTFDWDGGNEPTVNTGIAVVDSALIHQVRRLGAMQPREALETVMGTFFNYAPTMMFFLLPLFAAVLKLLYIRRGRFYAEHFVFLLHVHSFVFFLAGVMLVVGQWVGGWLELGLNLWILVYIYLAMRRVYGQGRFKTFVKYWTLGWAYFWILLIFTPVAFVATLLLV